MKTMLAAVTALAIGLVAAAPAEADKFEDIVEAGVVRIGVPLDVPPFGYQDADRNPEVELQQITGANRIPFLLTDKVDLVISVMGLTPERAKQIMFSAPYANTFLAVYGPASASVSGPEEFGDLKVAAAKGTTQEMTLTAQNPDADIMRTEDDATAAAAYLSGQADLFATNSIVASSLAEQNPTAEFDRKFVIRRSPAHIGVPMGEFELLQWVNSFIFFNTMNGELERLHQTYLGIPMDPLPTL